MINLIDVARIVKKASGHIFIYDINENLLEVPCKTKEIRRPFVSGSIQNVIQFSFDEGTTVQFETNRITYVEYSSGRYEEWPDLGPIPDPVEAQEKFLEVYAYLAEYVFMCCCDEGDGPSPFPYPTNTYAAWLATLNANTLPKGLWIEVTEIPSQPGAVFSMFCTETNQIALGGFGQFLNADWQNVGNYDGVIALTGVPVTGNNRQWYSEQEFVTIEYNNLAGGSFAPSETVTDSVSGATALIVSDSGTELKCYLTSSGLVFGPGSSIDNGSGVTADVVAYTNAALGTGNGLVIIYNCLHYQVTGYAAFDGTTPDLNTSAYTLLPITDPDMGYINEVDEIEFDFVPDWLQYRADKRGNTYRYSQLVDTNNFALGYSAINLFQWGKDGSIGNIFNDGLISQINALGNISENEVSPLGSIHLNDFTSTSGIIIGNMVMSGASIILNTLINAGSIAGNTILTNASLASKSITTSIDSSVIGVTFGFTENINIETGFTRQPGLCTQTRDIDITGLTTLDLSTVEQAGIYNITGGATETIDEITNFPTAFPFTLKPDSGLSLTIDFTAVGSLAANDIVGPTGTAVFNGANGDEITLTAATIATFGVTKQTNAIQNA